MNKVNTKVDKTKLQDHIWLKCQTLSIELEYSKSKSKRAQYDILSEVWNGIKDGKFDYEGDEEDEL